MGLCWLWYEWWVFGGCSIGGGFLVGDWVCGWWVCGGCGMDGEFFLGGWMGLCDRLWWVVVVSGHSYCFQE